MGIIGVDKGPGQKADNVAKDNIRSTEPGMSETAAQVYDSVIPPDSGAIPPDSGAIPPDSGVIPPDSGVIHPDSGAKPPDSGAIPPDSGVIHPDSGVIHPDSGVIHPDSGVKSPDSGVIPPDSGVIPPDSGAIPPDSGAIPPDSGVIPPDSGVIPPDSGVIPPDSGVIPPDSDVIPPDSGVIPPDSGAIPPDSGVIPPGSGAIPLDSGVIPPDSGVISPDSGVIPPDSGVIPPDSDVISPDSGVIPPDSDVIPSDSVVIPPDSGVEQLDGSLKSSDDRWAWVVCFACFITTVTTGGSIYSFGVIYVELLNYFGKSKGETAVIASMTPSVTFLVGPLVAGAVNRFGCRIVVVVGALLSTASLVMSMFAPNMQFLYFSLGTLLGIGYGMIYLPSVVSLSQHFDKHRALATGIALSGTGVGTFIYSPLTSWLIELYSWKGAILVHAGIMLNCLNCGLVYRPIQKDVRTKDIEYRSTKSEELFEGADRQKHLTTSEEGLSNSSSFGSRNTIETSYSIHDPSSNFTELSEHCLQCQTGKPFSSGQRKDCEHNTCTCISGRQSECEQLPAEIQTSSERESVLRYNASKTSLPKSKRRSAIKSSTEDVTLWQQLRKSFRRSFNLDIFRNVAFRMFFVSKFFYSFGYYVPYLYLPDIAREAGVDEIKAALLLSAIGITNTIGRVIFGILSDRKCINTRLLYGTALTICGIVTSFVPFLTTYELVLAFCIVYGTFSSVGLSMTSVILADIVGIQKLPDALGVTNFFRGIGLLLGAPVAGWLYDLTGDYVVSYITAGVALFCSGTMLYFIPCVDKKYNQR